MEMPVVAAVAQDLFPSRLPARVAVQRSRRRRQRVRTWGIRLALLTVCLWTAAVIVVVGMGQ